MDEIEVEDKSKREHLDQSKTDQSGVNQSEIDPSEMDQSRMDTSGMEQSEMHQSDMDQSSVHQSEEGQSETTGMGQPIIDQCRGDQPGTSEMGQSRMNSNPQRYHENNDQSTNVIESPSTKQCGICQSYISSRMYFTHLQSCKNAEEYVTKNSCNICDKIFNSSQEVHRHVKDTHQMNGNDITETSNSINEAINTSRSKSIEEIAVEEAMNDNVQPIVTMPNENDGGVSHVLISGLTSGNRQIVPIKPEGNYYYSSGHHIGQQFRKLEYQSPRIDPYMITQLFICPVCLGKFADVSYIQGHISNFHKIPVEHQQRLGLEIQCVDV